MLYNDWIKSNYNIKTSVISYMIIKVKYLSSLYFVYVIGHDLGLEFAFIFYHLEEDPTLTHP